MVVPYPVPRPGVFPLGRQVARIRLFATVNERDLNVILDARYKCDLNAI